MKFPENVWSSDQGHVVSVINPRTLLYRRNIWLTYKILRFWSIIMSKTQNANISARLLRSFVTIHFLKIAGLLENSKILGRSLRSLLIFYKFLTRVFFWSNWNNECCNTQGCYCADKICDWPWNKILRSRRMVCLRKKWEIRLAHSARS